MDLNDLAFQKPFSASNLANKVCYRVEIKRQQLIFRGLPRPSRPNSVRLVKVLIIP